MPCNIGYKSYSKVVIPEPMPQTFKAKAEAPNVDADLLAKLGNEDPDFLGWIEELDVRSLLGEALRRVLARVDSKGVEFKINEEGMLEAKGKYFSVGEKRRLDQISSDVSNRWQFEILGIVTQLLGYTFTITQKGDELILEAEEEGKSHPCDYIKVTKKGNNATLTFEHFKSRGKLELATAKFLALADRLGVKISISNSTVSEGDAFPSEHRHSHTHGHGHHHHHTHGHDHDHED